MFYVLNCILLSFFKEIMFLFKKKKNYKNNMKEKKKKKTKNILHDLTFLEKY
jgi:hypothetical protein